MKSIRIKEMTLIQAFIISLYSISVVCGYVVYVLDCDVKCASPGVQKFKIDRFTGYENDT